MFRHNKLLFFKEEKQYLQWIYNEVSVLVAWRGELRQNASQLRPIQPNPATQPPKACPLITRSPSVYSGCLLFRWPLKTLVCLCCGSVGGWGSIFESVRPPWHRACRMMENHIGGVGRCCNWCFVLRWTSFYTAAARRIVESLPFCSLHC